MYRTTLTSVFLSAALVSMCAAEPVRGKSIPELIGGKSVVLQTMGFEFPLRYGVNGTVTGDGSAVGLSRYFNPTETGSWWVSGDKLCQKFPTWYKGKTWCFDLESAGKNRLRWRRDDGFIGKAVISG